MIKALIVVAISLTTSFTNGSAHADTYTVYTLSPYNNPGIASPAGIDDFGNVLVSSDMDCGISTSCLQLYSQGQLVSIYPYQPPASFIFDNGTPCNFNPPAGNFLEDSICNNGYQVVGFYGTTLDIREFYPGSDPSGDLVLSDFEQALLVNRNGDFVFSGEFGIKEVIINSTPEPSTLVFLATGAIGIFGIASRKYARNRKQ